jgi:hypothetical protein
MSRRKVEGAEASVANEVVVSADVVNEQIMIAAALVDADVRARLTQRLTPDHFVTDGHASIWIAIQELERKKLSYDPATLQRLAGDAVDVRYLASLIEMRPDAPDNLDFHVGELHWDRVRAIACDGPITALLEAVRNPREAPERVRALARQVGHAFDGGSASNYIHDATLLVHEQSRDIMERIEGRAIYPYGVKGLDFYEHGAKNRKGEDIGFTPRISPGAAPGMTTVLSALSGGGKTTLASHLALGLARQRRKVAYGAFEVNAGMTLEIMACISLGWSRTKLMNGKIDRAEIPILEERMHNISKWVTFVRNPFRKRTGEKSTNDTNLDLLQDLIGETGCEVFIADLWKRCLRETDPSAEEAALERQQAMAEEMRMHCILLQQQRLKDIESRADKRPTREGIKGSSMWVDIADTILAPHRPFLAKPTIDDDKIEIFILKQRYGAWPLGAEFDWDGEKGSIEGGKSIAYDAGSVAVAEPSGGENPFTEFAPAAKRNHSDGKRRRRAS